MIIRVQIDCTLKHKICIMNTIGFQNFRRFQNFDQLEYSGITFLVGRNNSGKSTVVKALMLLDKYFKSGRFDILSFGNHVLEDANIVTYGRAKNNQAQENLIHFIQKFENYLIELTLTGDNDKTFASVYSLSIHDISKKLEFVFNMQNKYVKIIKSKGQMVSKVADEFISVVKSEINIINQQLENPGMKKTSKEYIELVSKLEKLHEKIKTVVVDVKEPNQDIIDFVLEDSIDLELSLTEIINRVLTHSTFDYEMEYNSIQNGEQASERFQYLRAFKELNPSFVSSSFIYFMTLVNDISIVYMGANTAKQSALFAIRDKNNALAQAIHEYKQLNILEGEEEHLFVIKWMQEFEVGDNFTISMHAGEAYEMKILSNNVKIHLADKGMGSIQAMLLIMRIACVIKKLRLAEKNSSISRSHNEWIELNRRNLKFIFKTIVLIEEPELNLHPALQSKLADLFLDVHQRFKVDFLIETHSEYILRRSQVMVAENEFEVAPNENPFCVNYFPKEYDQMPYQLKYQPDGTFDKNFESGFFDTASLDTLKLLRIKREKKA